MARRRRHSARLAIVATGLTVLLAAPAFAHEGERSTKASVLVRQAIALIVNSPHDTMAVEDKIGDALESDDTAGVDLDLVRRAKDALDAGDLHRVRALLEVAIGARAHLTSALPLDVRQTPVAPGSAAAAAQLATGDEPGAGLADDPLRVHRHLDGRTTTMLVLSLLAIAVGAGLAIRYRPIPTRRLRREVRS